MKRKRLWSILLIFAMFMVLVPKETAQAATGPFNLYTTYYAWSRDCSQVEARYIWLHGIYQEELHVFVEYTETVSTTASVDAYGNTVYTAEFSDSKFTTQRRTVCNPDNVVNSWDFETDPANEGWTLEGLVWENPSSDLIGRSGEGCISVSDDGLLDKNPSIKKVFSAESPKVTLPEHAILSFWAAGGMNANRGVPFQVLISENNKDYKVVWDSGNFNYLSYVYDGYHNSFEGVYPTGIDQKQYVIDLSEYSGKTVNIKIVSDVYTGVGEPLQSYDYTLYFGFKALFDEFEIHGDPSVGWIKNSDGKWLYNDETGTPVTGWQEISNKWYYFDKSGIMQTGWQKIGKKWYFFNNSGIMQTGWKKSGGKWYYLDLTSGQMVTGWKQISGKWYYFKTSGIMAAKEYCKGYWLNTDGTWTYKAKASWKKNSKGWWYGDTTGWYAKNQTLTIDDKSYTFDKNGYCTNP